MLQRTAIKLKSSFRRCVSYIVAARSRDCYGGQHDGVSVAVLFKMPAEGAEQLCRTSVIHDGQIRELFIIGYPTVLLGNRTHRQEKMRNRTQSIGALFQKSVSVKIGRRNIRCLNNDVSPKSDSAVPL